MINFGSLKELLYIEDYSKGLECAFEKATAYSEAQSSISRSKLESITFDIPVICIALNGG